VGSANDRVVERMTGIDYLLIFLWALAIACGAVLALVGWDE
jgi:hypothetical protein